MSSFLQMLDSDKSHSLVIAATNFELVIDKAIVRRFDSGFSIKRRPAYGYETVW